MKLKVFLTLILAILLTVSGMAIDPTSRKIEDENINNEIKDIQKPAGAPVVTNLGISCARGAFDITSDSNNTVHMVWWANDGYLHYGNIVGNAVVNEEVVPQSNDVQINFIRPRIMARPDGASIHLTWMSPRPGTNLVHVWKDSNGWHREIVWKGNYISVPVGVADLTGKVHIIGMVWDTAGGFFSKIKYWYKNSTNGNYNQGWTLVEGPIKWRDTAMFVDRTGGIHGVYKSGRDPGKYVYCANGGSLSESEVLDIPIAKNAVCVSFGDLFVDNDLNVHHAFMSYNTETIDYSMKPAGTKKFSQPVNVSDGALTLCHIENYDNAWPSIAVGPDGIIYVAWADMPCPDTEANRISLATNVNGVWDKEIVTLDANIDFDSKPALTANADGVFLMWRDWMDDLYLYSITSKEVYISNLAEGQKVCVGDYTDGVIPIQANVTNPSEYSKVEFYVDGTLLGEVTASPYTYNWDASDVTPGIHAVKVIGYKNSSETVDSTVNIDINCPPTVNFANLFDGSTVYETLDVKVDVTDDKNEINRVEFFVDGDHYITDSTAPYEFTWDTSSLTLGNHTLTAIAYDDSSLSSEETITVRYWPIFPPVDVTATQKTNRTLFFVEYYNEITWKANTKNTSVTVTGYRVYEVVNGVKQSSPLADVSADTFECVHRNLEKDKQYSYGVTSVDSSGYESAMEVVTVN